MERSLLDTDMFSEVLRARNQAVVRQASEYLRAFGKFTISAITVSELVDGLRRKERDSDIELLCEAIRAEGHEVLPIDMETARIAGLIFGDLYRTGQPIGRADPFIAAVAIRHTIPLVTGKTRHFERLEPLGYALKLDDWRNLK